MKRQGRRSRRATRRAHWSAQGRARVRREGQAGRFVVQHARLDLRERGGVDFLPRHGRTREEGRLGAALRERLEDRLAPGEAERVEGSSAGETLERLAPEA